MDSMVDRRHKMILKRVRADLFPSSSAGEKKRFSAAFFASGREEVIKLVNEELDPAPPVHSSGRIWKNKCGD